MIKSFKDKETARVFAREFSKKFSENIANKAFKKMLIMDNTRSLTDLKNPPGNRLEKLSGDRQGHYSIRINDQYRICFSWGEDNHLYDVEIIDYH
ncbi:MAG: type II toxin-antitoxin system RelE/ParE family toxin [Hydrotalea sp.]|nr:type II toxin-antitoxin system RelE/ParE family toxin [Hydrotalea sp.]